MPSLRAVWGPGFPVQAWREPKPPFTKNIQVLAGYTIALGARNEFNTQEIVRQRRYEIDVWRDRQDDFFTASDLTLNVKGLLERRNFSVLYRIDSRLPSELIAQNGFGPSRTVTGIHPMIAGDVLVTSASLRASIATFSESTIPSVQAEGPIQQYAINPGDTPAASWLENYKYLTSDPDIQGHTFELTQDETHIDANAITADRIYLIGSTDEGIEKRLAAMLRDGVGCEFGISVTEYCEREQQYQYALADTTLSLAYRLVEHDSSERMNAVHQDGSDLSEQTTDDSSGSDRASSESFSLYPASSDDNSSQDIAQDRAGDMPQDRASPSRRMGGPTVNEGWGTPPSLKSSPSHSLDSTESFHRFAGDMQGYALLHQAASSAQSHSSEPLMSERGTRSMEDQLTAGQPVDSFLLPEQRTRVVPSDSDQNYPLQGVPSFPVVDEAVRPAAVGSHERTQTWIDENAARLGLN